MDSLEMFYKEINLAGNYMEHSISCAMDMMGIEVFEEAEGDSKIAKVRESLTTFINKAKDSLVTFFKKIKEVVNRKVKEFKQKVELKKLERMWKQNINNVITVTNYAEEKKIKKLYKDFVSESFKYLDKAYKCNDSSKITVMRSQYLTYANRVDKEVDKLVTVFKTKCSINGLNMLMSCSAIDEMDDIAQQAFSEANRKQQQIISERALDSLKKAIQSARDEKAKKKAVEAAKAEESSISEKKSLISTIVSKICSFGKKCGTMISNNKGKIVASLIALGTIRAGVAVKRATDVLKNDVVWEK